jgi:hypothetical protein
MKLFQQSSANGTLHFYYIEYRGKKYAIRDELFIDFFLASNGVSYHPTFYHLFKCLPDTDLLLETVKTLEYPPDFEAELRGYYRVPIRIASDNIYGEMGRANIWLINTSIESGQGIMFSHHYTYYGSYEGYLKYASESFWGNL